MKLFSRGDRGATLAEYALVVGIMALVAIGGRTVLTGAAEEESAQQRACVSQVPPPEDCVPPAVDAVSGPAPTAPPITAPDGSPGTTIPVACNREPEGNSPIGAIETFEFVAAGQARMTGWALDPDIAGNNAIDVIFSVDGKPTAMSTRANNPNTYVANEYGCYGPNHGFDITMRNISTSVNKNVEICAIAVNKNLGDNTEIGCRDFAVLASGNPFGTAFDVFRSPGPGKVEVAGWAIDPDTTAPIPVHIYADQYFMSDGAGDLANRTRADIGSAFPGYGDNHGFSRTISLTRGGTRTFCVFALNVGPGDTNPLLDCRNITLPSGNPFGNHESATPWLPGYVRSVGWAIDPDTMEPIDVHIYVGGQGFSVKADKPRSDVGRAYPAYGNNHGFDAYLDVSSGGTKDVCAAAVNSGIGGNVWIGCKTVTMPSGNPFGYLDVARGLTKEIEVAGWTIDPDTVNPIKVHVYVSGWYKGQFTANVYRPDVGNAYPLYGSNHGFSAKVPIINAGSHSVCVYAINTGVGTTNPQLGSCRTVTVR